MFVYFDVFFNLHFWGILRIIEMLKRSYSRFHLKTTLLLQCVFLVYFQIQVFNGIFSLIHYSKKAINKFFFINFVIRPHVAKNFSSV